MESSEPALVPEWLRNSGNLNGTATTRSDNQTSSKLARNKSFVSNNSNHAHGPGQYLSSDRATSSYFRRSSSSNGSSHLSSHSSFGRNKHNKEWEKNTFNFRDKEKSFSGDRRHRDIADNFLNKYDYDGLRHSHSSGYGEREGMWHKRVVTEPSRNNINGIVTKVSPIEKNITFESDFPAFGAEERALNSEAGRVPSPGLNSVTSGEKWTSALAEVPVLVGSNETGISSMGLGSVTSLNMAEAVAQGPNRARNSTQLSVGTQKREELAIKQSKQLIPVTPSLPKILMPNSSEKLRNKVGQQQHPTSSLVTANHSLRSGFTKSEVSKQSNMGKLHLLKPMREKNGATALRDNLSSMNSIITPQPVSRPAASKGQVNSLIPDRKPVLTVLEKKPTSQVRSRNDFFNSVRKQSMANSSPVAVSPQVDDASSGLSPSEDRLSEGKCKSTCNGDSQKIVNNGKRHFNCNIVFSEEEEAAFLRSLGWEENSEEGGLTDDEISAFFRDVDQYINSKPFLKILQVQLFPTFKTQIGGISLSSSEVKLES